MKYDVVVQGAGLVGSLYVLFLKKYNPDIKVLLLDTTPLLLGWQKKDSYDLRISAFNLSSINYFKELEIWQELCRHRHGTFKHIDVFTDNGTIDFSSSELNKVALAYTFENLQVQSIMHNFFKNVNFAKGCVDTLEQNANSVDIILDSGEKITTSLLVGADGANSSIRRKLLLPISFTSYGQKAIIGNFRAVARENTAYQTFSKQGILAWLPLGEDKFSIVLSCSMEVADELQYLDDTDFIDRISNFDNSGIQKISSISKRVAVPLQGAHVNNYFLGRVVLIGDAAHVIHPLAGQGVNIGFKDASVLARLTANTSDIHSALMEYQKQRFIRNKMMQRLMESLHYCFVKNNNLQGLKHSLLNLSGSSFVKRQMLKIAI